MSGQNQFDDIGEWASGVAQNYEGELVLSQDEIEEIVDNTVSQLGNLVSLVSEIPATATPRPRGRFMLPDDLYNYLESGGLVSRDDDGAFIKFPIVYILKRTDDVNGKITYEVYIDEQT